MMKLWSAAGVVGLGLLLAGCDEGAGIDCADGEKLVNGQCVATVSVKLNSVGFLPERRKLATFAGGDGSFEVRRPDGSVAYSGKASGPVYSPDTDEQVYIADFTDLDEEGTYTLHASGSGSSASFRIASDVFVEAYRANMLGLYGQRCGTAVSFSFGGDTFSHQECHMSDASLAEVPGAEGDKPAIGGWHDAGDYGKYTNNGSFALGMMLLAWEHFEDRIAPIALDIPEHGGPLPDFLAECKWQLDWLLAMQFEDGSVSDRITTVNFDPLNVSPSASSEKRRFAPPSTVAAADFTAVVAMAARVYEPFDADLAAQYREAAERSYAYLRAQTSPIQPDLERFTGGYQSGDADDRMWAAAEIWKTTGDPDALADLEGRIGATARISSTWDWPDMQNMALVTYALTESDERNPEKVSAVTDAIFRTANGLVEASAANAYGRGIDAYYWGINGVIARNVIVLMAAHQLMPDDKYLDASIAQIDHLLGRNFFGRSQLTGIGHDPPREPHHRPSIADSVAKPWPGLLIGGPWSNNPNELPATLWNDAYNDATTNEVAINWTGAMLYALAPFL